MSDWTIVFIVACVTFIALVGICAWYGVNVERPNDRKSIDKKYQLPKHTGKR